MDFLALLAAGINLELTQEQAMIGVVIGVLLMLLNAVGGVVNIWDRTRKRPTAEEVFATKDELVAAAETLRREFDSGRIVRRLESVEQEMKRLKDTVSKEMSDISRALGRLEGHQQIGGTGGHS